jgi:hypothetical protein
VPAGGEQQQRGQVGRRVDDLRGRAGVQEGQPDRADQQEDQEAAGAGAEEAVVEADPGAAEQGRRPLRPGPQPQRSTSPSDGVRRV